LPFWRGSASQLLEHPGSAAKTPALKEYVREQMCPVQNFNTRRGTLLVSSPEATALDLVGYATRHAGGLIQVAGVLPELAERIDP